MKNFRSVLAKIHMVTKQTWLLFRKKECSVLAKIHMVTKHCWGSVFNCCGSVLAKIHMVTKLTAKPHNTRQLFCSSKNSYGNKTPQYAHFLVCPFCSSKNSYGNKTD